MSYRPYNPINRVFWFGLAGVWTAILSTSCVVACLINKKLGPPIQRIWAKGLCRIGGLKVRVEGMEHLNFEEGVVISPNHESILDIILIASLPIDFRWISKKEIRDVPIMGSAMVALGFYFVERSRTNRDIQVLKEVEDGLKEGISVAIFPEGTRTRTGELGPFKKGAFVTARNAVAKILPIAIQGTYAVCPRGKKPQGRGAPVLLRIGPLFDPSLDKTVAETVIRYRQHLTSLLAANKTL